MANYEKNPTFSWFRFTFDKNNQSRYRQTHFLGAAGELTVLAYLDGKEKWRERKGKKGGVQKSVTSSASPTFEFEPWVRLWKIPACNK